MGGMVTPVVIKQPLPSLKIGLCCLKHRLESPLVQSLWKTALTKSKIGA
jgi:hypothetical protein